MRRQIVGWVVASLAVGVSGCQSWSQVGQGIPSGARVPPPGTGTFQVPSSYYNNGAAAANGAVSSTSQPAGANHTVASAGTTSTARTASHALPSTGSATGSNIGGPSTAGPNAATTASLQIPTVDQVRSGINNTASAVLADASNRANQVVQAGTNRAAAAVEKYTDSAPSLRPMGAQAEVQPASYPGQSSLTQSSPTLPASAPSGRATSRSLSDSSAEEDPQLDWQAPQ